eukprot:14367375-Ditylum_brightwellii.AAC.1
MEEALLKQKEKLLKEREDAIAKALSEKERIDALSRDAESIAQFYSSDEDLGEETSLGQISQSDMEKAIEEALARQRIELIEKKDEA